MAIVLPLLPSHEIQSFDGLKTVLERWLDGAESVSTYPDEMVNLAEAYIRRLVLHHDREGVTTLTATSASVALPSDFMQFRSAYVAGDPITPLDMVSPDVLRRHWTSSYTATPQECAVQAATLLLGPAPDQSYSIVMTYQRALTPLSEANQTNWVLEGHYDLYLYAAMMHAEVYAGNDERAAVLKGAADQMIADINAEGLRKRHSGPIRMHAAVQERC